MEKNKRNSFIILFAILTILLLIGLSSCKGSEENTVVMTGLDLNARSWAHGSVGYAPGEPFNPTGLQYMTVYSDGSREIITSDDVIYLLNGKEIAPGYIFTGDEGDKSSLQLLYKKDNSIKSNYIEFPTGRRIQNVEAITRKKSYRTDDDKISLQGLEVIVHYEDPENNLKKVITFDQNQVLPYGGITTNYNDGDTLQDNDTLDVTYAEHLSKIQLYFSALSDNTLSAIRIKNNPTKIRYNKEDEETFNPEGLVLSLVYETGEPVTKSYEDAKNDLTFFDSDGNALNPGVSVISEDTIVKVFYKNLSETVFKLYSLEKGREAVDSVTSFTLSSFEGEPRVVSKENTNEEYSLPSDLRIIVTHSLSGETSMTITDALNEGLISVDKTRVNLKKAGIYTVGVTLLENYTTCFYTVRVNEKDSSSIEIYRNNAPVHFFKGSFSYPKGDEMILKLTYDNGDEEYKYAIEENFDHSRQYNIDKTPGVHSVEVRFGSARTSYDVTIVDLPTFEIDYSDLHLLSYDSTHVDVYYSTDGSIPLKDRKGSTLYTAPVSLGNVSIPNIKGVAYLKDDDGNILEKKDLVKISYQVPSDLEISSVSLVDMPTLIQVNPYGGTYSLPQTLKMKINYKDGRTEKLLVKDNPSITLDTDLNIIDLTREGEYEIRLSYLQYDAAYILRVVNSIPTQYIYTPVVQPGSDTQGQGTGTQGQGTPQITGGYYTGEDDSDPNASANYDYTDDNTSGKKKIKSVVMIPDGSDFAYVGSYSYPTHTYNGDVYKSIKITYTDGSEYSFIPEDSNFATTLDYVNSKPVGTNVSLTIRYDGDMLQCKNNLRLVALPQPTLLGGKLKIEDKEKNVLRFENANFDDTVIYYTIKDAHGDIVGKSDSLYNDSVGIKIENTCTVEARAVLRGRSTSLQSLSYTYSVPDMEISENIHEEKLYLDLDNADDYVSGYTLQYREKEEGGLYPDTWTDVPSDEVVIKKGFKDKNIEVRVSTPNGESKTKSFTLVKATPVSVRMTNAISDTIDYFINDYTYPIGRDVLTVTYSNGESALRDASSNNFKVSSNFATPGEKTITPHFEGINGTPYTIRIVATPSSSVVSNAECDYKSTLKFSPLADGMTITYSYNGVSGTYNNSTGILITEAGDITNITATLPSGSQKTIESVTGLTIKLPLPRLGAADGQNDSKIITVSNSSQYPTGTVFKYSVDGGSEENTTSSFSVRKALSKRVITLHAECFGYNPSAITIYEILETLNIEKYLNHHLSDQNDGEGDASVTITCDILDGESYTLRYGYGNSESSLTSSVRSTLSIPPINREQSEKTLYIQIVTDKGARTGVIMVGKIKPLPVLTSPTLTPSNSDGTASEDTITVSVSNGNWPQGIKTLNYKIDGTDQTPITFSGNTTSFQVAKDQSGKRKTVSVSISAPNYTSSSEVATLVNGYPKLNTPSLEIDESTNINVKFIVSSQDGASLYYKVDNAQAVKINNGTFTIPRSSANKNISVYATKNFYQQSENAEETVYLKFTKPTIKIDYFDGQNNMARVTVTCANTGDDYKILYGESIDALTDEVAGSKTFEIERTDDGQDLYVKVSSQSGLYGESETSSKSTILPIPSLSKPTLSVDSETKDSVTFRINVPSSSNWNFSKSTPTISYIIDGGTSTPITTSTFTLERGNNDRRVKVELEKDYYKSTESDEITLYRKFGTPSLTINNNGDMSYATATVTCSNIPSSGYSLRWGNSLTSLDNIVDNALTFRVNKTLSSQEVYVKLVPNGTGYGESEVSNKGDVSVVKALSTPSVIIRDNVGTSDKAELTISMPGAGNWPSGVKTLNYKIGNATEYTEETFEGSSTTLEVSKDVTGNPKSVSLFISAEGYKESATVTKSVNGYTKLDTPTFIEENVTGTSLSLKVSNLPSGSTGVKLSYGFTNALGSNVTGDTITGIEKQRSSRTIYVQAKANYYRDSEISSHIIDTGTITTAPSLSDVEYSEDGTKATITISNYSNDYTYTFSGLTPTQNGGTLTYTRPGTSGSNTTVTVTASKSGELSSSSTKTINKQVQSTAPILGTPSYSSNGTEATVKITNYSSSYTYTFSGIIPSQSGDTLTYTRPGTSGSNTSVSVYAKKSGETRSNASNTTINKQVQGNTPGLSVSYDNNGTTATVTISSNYDSSRSYTFSPSPTGGSGQSRTYTRPSVGSQALSVTVTPERKSGELEANPGTTSVNAQVKTATPTLSVSNDDNGTASTVSITGYNSAITYTWSLGSGSDSSRTFTRPSVGSSATTVTVTAKENGKIVSNSASASVPSQVRSTAPRLSVSYPTATTALVTIDNPVNGAIYSWTSGGSGSDYSHTYNRPSAGSGSLSVSVTVKESGKISSSSSTSVSAQTKSTTPQLSVSYTSDGLSATVTITNYSSSYDYSWSGNPPGSGDSRTYSRSSSSDTTVTVTASKSGEVSSQGSTTVNKQVQSTAPTLLSPTYSNDGRTATVKITNYSSSYTYTFSGITPSQSGDTLTYTRPETSGNNTSVSVYAKKSGETRSNASSTTINKKQQLSLSLSYSQNDGGSSSASISFNKPSGATWPSNVELYYTVNGTPGHRTITGSTTQNFTKPTSGLNIEITNIYISANGYISSSPQSVTLLSLSSTGVNKSGSGSTCTVTVNPTHSTIYYKKTTASSWSSTSQTSFTVNRPSQTIDTYEVYISRGSGYVSSNKIQIKIGDVTTAYYKSPNSGTSSPHGVQKTNPNTSNEKYYASNGFIGIINGSGHSIEVKQSYKEVWSVNDFNTVVSTETGSSNGGWMTLDTYIESQPDLGVTGWVDKGRITKDGAYPAELAENMYRAMDYNSWHWVNGCNFFGGPIVSIVNGNPLILFLSSYPSGDYVEGTMFMCGWNPFGFGQGHYVLLVRPIDL